MKIKKEYIILPVVIVVLLLILIFANTGNNINYKIPKLPAINLNDIDKIEFTATGKTTVMEKDENTKAWMMEQKKYTVDKSTITQILNDISELTILELISDKKAYARYDLNDGKRVPVTAFVKGKVVRMFDIGKTSSAGHTFIKLDKDPNIYSVKKSIRANFEKSFDDLRDKTIVFFDKAKINRVEIANKGKTIVLNKTIVPVPDAEQKDKSPASKEKEVWQITGDNRPVSQIIMDNILNTFSNLICERYLPETEKVDFAKAPFTISAFGDKEYKLTIMEGSDDNLHNVLSNQTPYISVIVGWKKDNMIKTIDDLVEKPAVK